MPTDTSRYLGEEALELRTILRRFVAERMPRPDAAAWDKAARFPRDVFDALAELGVMGLAIPEEHGGAGRDIHATLMVIEELSKRSMAVAIPYIMASCYAGMTVVDCASEEQKARWLPEIAAGRMLFAYGWTEPDVGADLASVRTTVRRDGDELVVNGAKRFCTGAGISDYIYTLANSDPDGARYHNLSLVLVPPDADGVTITPIDAMGVKGSQTTDVTFDDVRVPAGLLMGGADGWNNGWSMITGSGLDIEKLEVAAMALGLGSAAYEDAAVYAEQREQFGVPVVRHQSVAHSLADMRVDLYASRLVLDDAAERAARGEPCGVQTSMAKLFVTEAGKRVVLAAQTILGAYGYVADVDVERYVRDVLLMPIIGGSSAIQRNNIHKWSRRR
ncbi:putative Acyl-CoA dehydrogenase [Frankia canadensis]|uniref:Putative Acyl-CoA dehydrogenase n=1 Tax=Frankia canadensis TaxID=1836972 RepID=A0A2I2KRK7_9ACTN|nr:acyl-CoA dehydrogenase family protein [Frankia canadensis]SNQ48303.1 putative Acyl-CoA dehydrogenase [Frankia canadensis]SOU55593.1 putative Acyl-CoA dehydrogenase [Frankia canadensis]